MQKYVLELKKFSKGRAFLGAGLIMAYIIIFASPAKTQTISKPTSEAPKYLNNIGIHLTKNPLTGKWSYRSFHNDPDLSKEFNKLKFGAGIMEILEHSPGILTGKLGGTGWSLNLKGFMTNGNPRIVRFQGKGEIGGETWIYDYKGYWTELWPNGEDQRPALVGTIIRTVPHTNGAAKAGYVASWIAVKQD